MFRKLKEFFFGKPEPVFEAPYKVEAVTLPPPQGPVLEPVAEPVVILVHDPVVAVVAAPAKKPRKPRAPKVVVQPKEKAPKKKPVAAMTAKPKAKKS
jgi:hypothetical protein